MTASQTNSLNGKRQAGSQNRHAVAQGRFQLTKAGPGSGLPRAAEVVPDAGVDLRERGFAPATEEVSILPESSCLFTCPPAERGTR